MTMLDLYNKLIEITKRRRITLIDDIGVPDKTNLRGIWGLYWAYETSEFIWIKPTLPLAQKITVLAHELGHFKLHKGTGLSHWDNKAQLQQKEAEATEYGHRLIRYLIHSNR